MLEGRSVMWCVVVCLHCRSISSVIFQGNALIEASDMETTTKVWETV